MKFKTITRISIIAILVAAAAFYLVADRNGIVPTTAQNNDPLYFPVLLVHGLGEGPGAETFGNLEQYLRDFYFDVEVMDFNDFNGKKYAKKDGGELGAAAAALGTKIKEIAKKYKVAKVNIVAHSFGGLVTQAYLLGMARDYDKKVDFEDDVNKVIYIQTPFYGVNIDSKEIGNMVEYTDYGRFAKDKTWESILAYGSEEIFQMHNLLDADNIYEEDIDAISMFSEDDEVVQVSSASLSSFIGTRENENFDRYLGFKNYSHTTEPVDPAAGTKGSLAWVENFNDENFLTIASFLDDGGLWQNIGDSDIEKLYSIMVQIDSNAGKLSGKEVTLELTKKIKAKGTKTPIKTGEMVDVIYNKDSRVFFFNNLGPGEYKIAIKTSKQKEPIEHDIELPAGRPYVEGFSYDAKENVISQGGRPIGGDFGILTLPEFVFDKEDDQEQGWYPLNGLNTDGFYIEFDMYNTPMKWNKATVFSLYSVAPGAYQGPDWRWNGGRLDITVRGEGSGSHYGKLTIHVNVDKNKDGFRDRYDDGNETIEAKTNTPYDWTVPHRVRVQSFYSNGRCYFEVYVDGEKVSYWVVTDGGADGPELSKTGNYYNPQPIISFGGRYFDYDKYFSAKGLIIRNLVVANLE